MLLASEPLMLLIRLSCCSRVYRERCCRTWMGSLLLPEGEEGLKSERKGGVLELGDGSADVYQYQLAL